MKLLLVGETGGLSSAMATDVPSKIRRPTLRFLSFPSAKISPFLDLVAVLLAATLVARFLWIVAKIARTLPEGPWPVIRFGLVAFVVCFGPGLALLRLSRCAGNPVFRSCDVPLFVLSTSLAASGLGAWALYAAGVFTRFTTISMLAAFAVAGAWGGCGARLRRHRPRRWIEPLVAFFVLEGVFESAAGVPYSQWDALITWDKWAADMGLRTGLGGYLTGGYPQLFPSIHAIFYKIAETPADAVFPAEHLLLHGFDVVFPALLVLAVVSLGRRFRFSPLLALAFLAANSNVFGMAVNGYADIPVAGFAAAAAALSPALAECRGDRRGLVPMALLFFALGFTKGTGIPLGVTIACWTTVRNRAGAVRVSWPALLAALAVILPFEVHQQWLFSHPAARDPSPFLVELSFKAAHTHLFSPDLSHFRTMIRHLASSYAGPEMTPFAYAVFAAGIAAVLASRRTRWLGLLLAGLLFFWFFTASYSWRNAVPALVLGSVLFAAQVSGERRPTRTGFVRRTGFAVLFFVFLSVGLARSGAGKTALKPFFRWTPPKAVLLRPEHRHMAMRPRGDLRNIFEEAPWAAAAKHIYTGDALYRILAPRGCYVRQLNGWSGVSPGDLAIGVPSSRPLPDGFVPVAEIRRAGPTYRTLWMNRPDLVPGSVLEIAAPPDGVPVTRDLFGAAASDDPFAPYLAPIRSGDVLRLPAPRRSDGPERHRSD